MTYRLELGGVVLRRGKTKHLVDVCAGLLANREANNLSAGLDGPVDFPAAPALALLPQFWLPPIPGFRGLSPDVYRHISLEKPVIILRYSGEVA